MKTRSLSTTIALDKLKPRKKKPGILQIISGTLLIALPTIPIVASATPYSRLNEEPDQRLSQQGLSQNLVSPARRTTSIQPPLPETTQSPIATVTPMANQVSVQLKNGTNAPISYQAIGHTEPRILPGGQEIVLQNLPTPVTVTMVREDGGLLEVRPMSSSATGMLAISLNEKTEFDDIQGALRIQPDGQVFLN